MTEIRDELTTTKTTTKTEWEVCVGCYALGNFGEHDEEGFCPTCVRYYTTCHCTSSHTCANCEFEIAAADSLANAGWGEYR